AGIVGLDASKNGAVIGTKFPVEGKPYFFHEIWDELKVKGDKKYVYRTEIINEFPRYPSFPGEKFPAQGYLYRLIGKKYPIVPFNEVFCVVEYLEDGNYKNKFESYKRNPNSFAFYRKEMIGLSSSFTNKLRHAIHFVSSCKCARKRVFGCGDTMLLALAYPFGMLLNLYLRKTKKKTLIH